jgi:peroxiredoxin
MTTSRTPAPAWQVERWFNTQQPLSLASLRGKVIVLEAFQMLCPGCVSEGLPQAQRVHLSFSPAQVAVIGLHTVFEHHQAMTAVSLEAFLHEYRINFPVAVDLPDPQRAIPHTMREYSMRGTPTLILIDAEGCIRQHYFGKVSDLQLGAEIALLLAEAAALAQVAEPSREDPSGGVHGGDAR